jgi:hypothetical protein
MNLQEIREIARIRGLKSRNLNKRELIRSIQRNEGNFDCFATAFYGSCDQQSCLWRKDCLNASSKQQ